MGKKGGVGGGGGGSWLTAVKRAFRSPTKEAVDKRCSEEDEEKKRSEKRRWIFRKPQPPSSSSCSNAQEPMPMQTQSSPEAAGAVEVEQKHNNAIAMAVATAAAAEASVATAQAAVQQVARLGARPSTGNFARHRDRYASAAIVIQTAFRGYLARRALRALRGLVKLQALVRGHNVRKQAKTTLRCMQALVRVQARVLDQRVRLSHSHHGTTKSTAQADSISSIWESRYLQEIADRISLQSKDGSSSIADGWDDRTHTAEEVKAMLQSRKEAALKRDRHNLSQAFSQQQMKRCGRNPPSAGNEQELIGGAPQWLDSWMTTKPWEGTGMGSTGRASTDQREREPNLIKTVEIDTSQPFSYFANPAAPNFRKPSTHQQHRHNQYQRSSTLQSNSSPLHIAQQRCHSPVTSSPSRTRPVAQVRSASPRWGGRDRDDYITNYQSVAQTPSLRSNYHYNPRGTAACTTSASATNTVGHNAGNTLPNYMAATESAKARIRSQSAPRQRPYTPERERTGSVAKKRLSYPVPDPYCGVGMGYGGQNLRSPSFKSVVSGAHYQPGIEQQSNYSSCYTESLGGEISPSSTSDLRRWLR